MVDGKEMVVTDMDESLKIQNEARNMLKMLKQVMVNLSSTKYQMSQTVIVLTTRYACKRGFSENKGRKKKF